jgi:prepilin-type N-terminal cleavage/methylation domain-containing protein
MRAQQGFTLIEMLVAMFVLLAGIVAALGVFAVSKDTSLVSLRHEVAVNQAQREMERLRAYSYDELALSSSPIHSNDVSSPDNRVLSGTTMFHVKSTGCGGSGQPPCDEQLVVDTSGTSNPPPVVDPGPIPFVVNERGATVRGNVYRYITWRNEDCPTGLCDGTHDTKRIIVAISIDPTRNLGPRNPIWLSSIAVDPTAGPPGTAEQQPAPDTSPSAQSFYLYDKRCSDDDATNVYAPPTAGHATHDTAAPLTSCENSNTSQRPDLMGAELPDYPDAPEPPYDFSNDLQPADYPAGLALAHEAASTTCPATSYPAGSSTGKYEVHAWATRKFNQDFVLSGRAFLSFWATSVGSVPATGRFCATLVDRMTVSGVPVDVVVGSMNREHSPWPTTKSEPGRSCGPIDFPCGRQLTFEFNLSGTKVRSGGRLMLFLSVLGTSEKNLVVLYDDPRYRSFLQIETTTPCNSTGTPCPNS